MNLISIDLVTRHNYDYFCNALWRKYISDLCKQIDIDNSNLEIISPFGFELLEDTLYLTKALRRFYCYIGLPNNKIHNFTASEISNRFSEALMSTIEKFGIKKTDIAIVVNQDKFNYFHDESYRCNSSDKLIDIQTRVVESDILTDYANYIICSIDSIVAKKDEPQHYFENKRHRSRTCQLYIMLEKIFGYLLPKLTVTQEIFFKEIFKLIDNNIQMFYSPTELHTCASNFEMDILHELINPRIMLMYQECQLSGKGELIKVKCNAYHVKGKLELVLSKSIYEKAVSKIKNTYLNFI